MIQQDFGARAAVKMGNDLMVRPAGFDQALGAFNDRPARLLSSSILNENGHLLTSPSPRPSLNPDRCDSGASPP